jgi:ribosomal protein L11 methyltransferase
MYLWRKYASARWLDIHENALQKQPRGGLAVIQSKDRKLLQLQVYAATRTRARSLREQFGGAIENLPRNWRCHLSEQRQTRPIRIGNRIEIRNSLPHGRKKTRGVAQLIIPAAGAFGTGEHATTAMCLRILERISRSWPDGWNMLDAGTGTGILALAARVLGAKTVIAIDSDPQAVAVADSNARLNQIAGIEFEIADATKYRMSKQFDVITGNLFSELLIRAIPLWRRRLKPTGVLILSGILRSQERDVIRSLKNSKFTTHEVRRRGKWIALLARRQKAG